MTNRILVAGFVAVVLSIWGSAWYIKGAIYAAGAGIESSMPDMSEGKRTSLPPANQSEQPGALDRMLMDEAAKRGQQ